MLNTENFTLLAGNPGLWDAETVRRCFEGEALPEVQIEQAKKGRKIAMLVKVMGGWYVRDVTPGFTGDPVLCRMDSKRDEAIRDGKKWANEDPSNREFFTRNEYLAEGYRSV